MFFLPPSLCFPPFDAQFLFPGGITLHHTQSVLGLSVAKQLSSPHYTSTFENMGLELLGTTSGSGDEVPAQKSRTERQRDS